MQRQGSITKLTRAPSEGRSTEGGLRFGEALELLKNQELIQNLLIHKSKFQRTLDKISGKYHLREARIRLEREYNERRRQEEQRYRLAFAPVA